MSEVRLYDLLSTCSKRAFRKRYGHWGRLKEYRPQTRLLYRLSRKTGLGIDQVYAQLLEEREEMLERGVWG